MHARTIVKTNCHGDHQRSDADGLNQRMLYEVSHKRSGENVRKQRPEPAHKTRFISDQCSRNLIGQRRV
jgi:hypothetical protein